MIDVKGTQKIEFGEEWILNHQQFQCVDSPAGRADLVVRVPFGATAGFLTRDGDTYMFAFHQGAEFQLEEPHR